MSSNSISIGLPLIQSNLTTPRTRSALQARAEAPERPYTPSFFTPDEYSALLAVCARLMGDTAQANAPLSDIIAWISSEIDQRLASRRSDGWRYNALPDDGSAYRIGLQLLSRTSEQRFGHSVTTLSDTEIDDLLASLASGESADAQVTRFNPSLWFGELLAEVVECFYSQPAALAEIGYVGFADAPGWQRIGLDRLEARESAVLEED